MPERYRVALVLGPILVLACCFMVLDAARGLLAALSKTILNTASVMAEWARPTISQKEAKPS